MTATMMEAAARRRYDSEYEEITQGHNWRRSPADRDMEWCGGCGMRLHIRRQDGQVTGVMVIAGLPRSEAGCRSEHTREGGFFLMNGATGTMDRVSRHDWECHGQLSRVEQLASAAPARNWPREAVGSSGSSHGVMAADGLAPGETGEQITGESWARLGHARRMAVLGQEALAAG